MPPWSLVDTIMFDMDGTLLDLHFDNYFWLTLVPKVYSQELGVLNRRLRLYFAKSMRRRMAHLTGTAWTTGKQN